MIRNSILTLFLLLFVFRISAQIVADTPFTVEIAVSNLKRPAKIIMTVREVGQWTEFTKESNDGKFFLAGKLKEPSFAYVVLKYADELNRGPRMGNIQQIFITNGTTSLTTKDSLAAAVIKGGKEQNELALLNAEINPSKKLTLTERQAVMKKFIAGHSDSFVSLYAIQNYSKQSAFTIEASDVSPLFKMMTTRMQNSLTGKELHKDILLAEHTMVGAVAPEFIQRDTTNKDVKFSSFRGQYVLVDFWASWCKPCRADNPALVKTFQKYNKRNFTILGVSLDNSRGAWVKAIKKDHLAWTHVSDLKYWKNEVALLYGVKTVPQNYLIGPDGKIIARNLSMIDLPIMLDKVLKN